MSQIVPIASPMLPALVAASGVRASYRFLEFFTANIRNPHTRAPMRAPPPNSSIGSRGRRSRARAVQSVHVATHRAGAGAVRAERQAAACRSAPPVRLDGDRPDHADYPAAAVRGPRHVVRRGKTPVLDPAEARRSSTHRHDERHWLRDRALIGPMVYSFARIGAAIGMRVEDVFTQNRRLWVRLNEKGGKRHAMPCHHNLEEYLTAYLDGAELRGDPKGPLFRTIGRGTGKLTRTVLPQANAYAMIRRRAAAAGIATKLGNHSFRATGITAYLKNGCTLEKAAAMANHASTRTTQLYDRRRDEVSLDEVERITI